LNSLLFIAAADASYILHLYITVRKIEKKLWEKNPNLKTKIFFSQKDFEEKNPKIVLDALTKNMEMLGGPEN